MLRIEELEDDIRCQSHSKRYFMLYELPFMAASIDITSE